MNLIYTYAPAQDKEPFVIEKNGNLQVQVTVLIQFFQYSYYLVHLYEYLFEVIHPSFQLGLGGNLVYIQESKPFYLFYLPPYHMIVRIQSDKYVVFCIHSIFLNLHMYTGVIF